MSKPLRLLVGLGNPGPEYQATRHNAGFWWIERLADAHRVNLREESKFLGHTGRMSADGGETWLLEPQTFMNASGRSVLALARFYKILPDEILVVHDELDLAPGTVRLKFGGGHGGHNGLRDIIAHLGNGDFWRLRVGIGHPGDRAEVVNYVLHRPRPDEDKLIDEALDRSLKLAPMLLAGRFESAMHKLHSGPRPPKPPKPEAGEAAEPNPGTPS